MADVSASGTDIQIATDSNFSDCVISRNVGYRVSEDILSDALPYGVNLYARVRHRHPETGISNWSSTSAFRIVVPASIIGVCLDNTGVNGVFYWIDSFGNKLDAFDWTKHPTYRSISMATVDDARSPVTLTKFPLFYVKTAVSGPVGTFSAGKKCWWISDIMETGFRPAACFKRTTAQDASTKYVIAPFCYISTFLGHTETAGGVTCLGSKRGQTVATSLTKSEAKTYITRRNNAAAGISGFRMFDIWDLGALRILLLIAKADSNTQLMWGDNSGAVSYAKTGSTNARAVFKGTHADPQISIEDLWRCYWYHADLIALNAGVITLTSPMDLTSVLSFGGAAAARYTIPTTQGWIRDILDCPMVIGDDTHDLMELFLPKTVVSSESQATFSDYNARDRRGVSNPNAFLCGGTGWDSTGSSPTILNTSLSAFASYTTSSGIFAMGNTECGANDSHVDTGSRLSKN